MNAATLSTYDLKCIVTFLFSFASFDWVSRFLAGLFRLHSLETFADTARPFYGRDVIFIKSVFWSSMDRLIVMFATYFLFITVFIFRNDDLPSISYIFIAFFYGIFHFFAELSSYREYTYCENQCKKHRHDGEGVNIPVDGDAGSQKLDGNLEEKDRDHQEDQNIKENLHPELVSIPVTNIQEYGHDHDISD